MKKNYFLTVILICCTISFGFSQIFDNDCSAPTEGWTFNSIEQLDETWRFSNYDDYVISETFGAYENLELVSNLRSNGNYLIPATCTIEISDDGGSTWTAGSYTVITVEDTNTDYIYNIGTLSGTNNKIRWKQTAGTIRLQINNITLTGESYTPAPEIDIERNTGATIPNGSIASTGYNTIFAETSIGNATSPKTYNINNEGTANLNITSITSSNPLEFPVSIIPVPTTLLPTTIAADTKEEFEITFLPIGASTRTATITILSNDADESPYTFEVQGTGDCVSASLSLSLSVDQLVPKSI
ncbi:hypothetical protein [Formosa sp. L2A11]|uniref:hypothetical protein n=1 Tax=Formosa sp. L2A11 TaxID=2686363 RepID=UPI00131CC6BC|nr:hypothetical protein [Formosa sp. L2A11]